MEEINIGEKPFKSNYLYQTIDIEKILFGEDIRTTLMIKNIPNRFELNDLTSLLDKSFIGCYDFVYLPIDFTVYLLINLRTNAISDMPS